MRTTTTTPAVYVGTYHKYNCGSIFGKWFDLTEFDRQGGFYEARQALHADEWDAEFMFQDWGRRYPSRSSSLNPLTDFIASLQTRRKKRQGSRFIASSGVYRRM